MTPPATAAAAPPPIRIFLVAPPDGAWRSPPATIGGGAGQLSPQRPAASRASAAASRAAAARCFSVAAGGGPPFEARGRGRGVGPDGFLLPALGRVAQRVAAAAGAGRGGHLSARLLLVPGAGSAHREDGVARLVELPLHLGLASLEAAVAGLHPRAAHDPKATELRARSGWGTARAVTFGGEPGIEPTRLVRQRADLEEQAHDTAARVWRCQQHLIGARAQEMSVQARPHRHVRARATREVLLVRGLEVLVEQLRERPHVRDALLAQHRPVEPDVHRQAAHGGAADRRALEPGLRPPQGLAGARGRRPSQERDVLAAVAFQCFGQVLPDAIGLIVQAQAHRRGGILGGRRRGRTTSLRPGEAQRRQDDPRQAHRHARRRLQRKRPAASVSRLTLGTARTRRCPTQ